jgi:hypothetical protein
MCCSWQQQNMASHDQSLTLGHALQTCMALSPDGQYLATVAPDRASNPASLIIFQVRAAYMHTSL